MPKKVVKVDRFKCAYCGACVSVCKFNANELIETFLQIYEDKCTGCGICVKVCPMGALEVIKCTT
jgi:ferredoxin